MPRDTVGADFPARVVLYDGPPSSALATASTPSPSRDFGAGGDDGPFPRGGLRIVQDSKAFQSFCTVLIHSGELDPAIDAPDYFDFILNSDEWLV